MDLSPLRELPERWRSDAEVLRRCGHERTADLYDLHAQQLECAVRAWWTEALNLQQAAEEIGLSYRAIQKRVERGQVPNVGKKGAPRVRRCDVYDGRGPRLETGEPDLAEEVLVSRLTGGA